MKNLTVTAAILINNNEILCMQRAKSKFAYISNKFEFPGGKVEEGESYETCLKREIKEEMNMDINVSPEDFFMTIDHEYPDFAITMHSYICKVDSRSFELKEHESFVWLKKDELMTLDWAPADIPIVEKLLEVL